jgi:hypothetical protein
MSARRAVAGSAGGNEYPDCSIAQVEVLYDIGTRAIPNAEREELWQDCQDCWEECELCLLNTCTVQAIPNAEREELWQDYLRDKEKRERDAKRAVRRERAATFRDLLLSTPAIKVALQS